MEDFLILPLYDNDLMGSPDNGFPPTLPHPEVIIQISLKGFCDKSQSPSFSLSILSNPLL